MDKFPSGGKEPLLKIENMQVEYEGTPIVRDFSVSVARGEIFGIVGESGCGKSTMLGAVLGMLGREGRIASGHIYFEGKDLSACKREDMRRLRGEHLGVVFQNPGETLNPSRRIETQFYEALRAHRKVTKAQAGEIAVDMMSRLNLEHGDALLKMFPFQLSGGMNQRVALALAMIMEPSLLLADEPTSALDVTVQAQAVDEMMKMRDRFGTAILIVTHNMGVVSHMADRVAVMYAGRMVEYGDKKKVLGRPVHPYTRALLNAIPDFSGNIPHGLPGGPPPFGSVTEGCEFASRCPYAQAECRKNMPVLRQAGDGQYSACGRKGVA